MLKHLNMEGLKKQLILFKKADMIYMMRDSDKCHGVLQEWNGDLVILKYIGYK